MKTRAYNVTRLQPVEGVGSKACEISRTTPVTREIGTAVHSRQAGNIYELFTIDSNKLGKFVPRTRKFYSSLAVINQSQNVELSCTTSALKLELLQLKKRNTYVPLIFSCYKNLQSFIEVGYFTVVSEKEDIKAISSSKN